MTKLVRTTDLARILGVRDERIWDMARTGKVRAVQLTCGRHGSAKRGRWYVQIDEAVRVMRDMLAGKPRAAAIRACYRAADRVHDSVHAVGLHPVAPHEQGKPVSDALLDQ